MGNKFRYRFSLLLSNQKIILILIYFILIIGVNSFLIQDCLCQSGWFEQPLPLNWNVEKIQFVNENTGWISMHKNNYPDYSCKLLKTTNGGYNWDIIDSSQNAGRFQFISELTGYAVNPYTDVPSNISKTTNGGATWFICSTVPYQVYVLSFINQQTGWVGGYQDWAKAVVMRTTDGGNSFQLINNSSIGGLTRLQFLSESFNGEYYGYCVIEAGNLYRTTNSGWNWLKVLEGNNMDNLFFLNKDSGWTTTWGIGNSTIVKYTSNGGANWITQLDWPEYFSGSIFFVDANKGWLGGGWYKIFITTDGGNIWGTQNIPTLGAIEVFAVSQLKAWATTPSYNQVLLHTTDGGGTVTGTGNENISEIPEETLLIRNYPNPFNSITNVKFQIKNSGVVNIKVFDLSGKEVRTLVNEYKPAGIYQVRFDAEGLPSGIYFCRLSVDNAVHTVKKMVIMK